MNKEWASKSKNNKRPGKRAVMLSEMLDLPPDMFGRLPQIEMTGNREIMIEGHRGIIEYGENAIKLSCGHMIMSITGSDLIIRSFNDEYLTASGNIQSIEFIF